MKKQEARRRTRQSEQAKEPQIPGYSRDKIVALKMVTMADGVMTYPMRRTLSAAMALKRKEFLCQKQEEINKHLVEHKIDVMVDLLCEEPENVLDFPADGRPLAERSREYFSDPANYELVNDLWEGYWGAVKPSLMFPSIPEGDGSRAAGAR
jgi:lysyl-tRNA synthetase class II